MRNSRMVNFQGPWILCIIGLSYLGCKKSNYLEIGKTAMIHEPSGMWINQKPSTKAKGIISVPDGETIAVIQPGPPEKLYGIQSNWYKVQWRNHVGWMWGGLAKTSVDNARPTSNLRIQKGTLTNVTPKEFNAKFGTEYFSTPEACRISGHYEYFVDESGKEILHGPFTAISEGPSPDPCFSRESAKGTFENGKPYGYFEISSRGYEGGDSSLTLFMNRAGNCNKIRFSEESSRGGATTYGADGLTDCTPKSIAAMAYKHGKNTPPKIY
jgi:hypothetical protein